VQPGEWLEHYRAGRQAEVWAELVALGAAVQDEPVRAHAEAVARETMTRARANVETLAVRLREAAYEFRAETPHVLPNDALREHVAAVESRAGPLPLSLRAFYETVGTVDFTQSLDQLVQWHTPARAEASELQVLGEYDPLVVEPLDDDDSPYPGWFFLACDEFHKANYSGGENSHVALPNPSADFHIEPVDERFVPYLRATFAGGGFRGRIDSDENRVWKAPPSLELTAMPALDLAPI
jgi:hypothetical protein